MVYVLISACLVAHPAECRTFKSENENAKRLEECYEAVPGVLKQWNDTHLPQWKMQSFACSFYDETKA